MNNSTRDRLARRLKSALPYQITHDESKTILDATLQILQDQLVEEGILNVPQLGKFSLRHVAERTVKSILDGEPVIIPAHKEIRYKTTEPLKRRLKDA